MHTAKTLRRRNKSLCERSTRIATNIVKASSLCLARITLGSLAPPPSRSMHARAAEAPAPAALAHDPRTKRLLEPESSAASYLMEPEPDEGDDGVRKGVDRRAEDYIARIHERNRSDPSARSEVSMCIPPPPNLPFFRR